MNTDACFSGTITELIEGMRDSILAFPERMRANMDLLATSAGYRLQIGLTFGLPALFHLGFYKIALCLSAVMLCDLQNVNTPDTDLANTTAALCLLFAMLRELSSTNFKNVTMLPSTNLENTTIEQLGRETEQCL